MDNVSDRVKRALRMGTMTKTQIKDGIVLYPGDFFMSKEKGGIVTCPGNFFVSKRGVLGDELFGM